MIKPNILKFLIFIALILTLAGCSLAPIPGTPPATRPGIELTISRTSEPLDTQLPEETNQTSILPAAVEYNLGETTITQSMFPEDSRFRNMPVRLNGIIAVPNGDGTAIPGCRHPARQPPRLSRASR